VTSRLACLAAALVVAAPCAGRAQFTALVTPPRAERRDTVVVAADSVPRAQLDTVRATELSNLKAWIDSAANVLSTTPPPAAEPRAAPDSASRPRPPARPAPDSARAPAAPPRDPGSPRPPVAAPPAPPAPAAPPPRRSL